MTCLKRTHKIIKKLTKKCNDRDLARASDAHNRTAFYENCLNVTNHLEDELYAGCVSVHNATTIIETQESILRSLSDEREQQICRTKCYIEDKPKIWKCLENC